ncbi:interferon-related developmental regulator family protein / IFRD protein family [Artemisia annua]|uniref:Interferon-related developmental regulator family protein / IFRD protein family n=1 Tax=Artemisia annua TaxID=35608 RepID=A0A2U1QN48_ARTAN|nr:interferon-related developmental regulator family protein / IFRD protein family [Artemisia annua]
MDPVMLQRMPSGFHHCNSRHKNAGMLDNNDSESVCSSSSTVRSDYAGMMGSAAEDPQLNEESVLDQSLDALYEKRGSTREKALENIIEAFNSSLPHEFIETKYATLLHQCLHSVKKGSSKEITLASHVIGLLALTAGLGEKAAEILEDSVTPISEALKSRSEAAKLESLLEGLAVIAFVGGNEPEETEKCMQLMWQVVHPKLGPNVVATKPSPAIITAVVSAWSFLLTTMEGWTLDPKLWQECVSYLSTLLDKDDRSVRIAAGEALALIYEMGDLEKFCGGSKGDSDSSVKDAAHIHSFRRKILNQVRNLSAEAGGKAIAKKDLNNQRNTFRDILEFLEDGYAPETSVKIGGGSLTTLTWSQLIQLNYMKKFLGGGFVKHMQENEFLHEVFNFTPKKKSLSKEDRVSGIDKRMYKSPNSILNKARTQFMSKQRMMSRVGQVLNSPNALCVFPAATSAFSSASTHFSTSLPTNVNHTHCVLRIIAHLHVSGNAVQLDQPNSLHLSSSAPQISTKGTTHSRNPVPGGGQTRTFKQPLSGPA